MTDIAKALASANMTLYNGLSDRALLTVRYASAQRMEKETADLDFKYDGKKAAAIEDQINSMADDAQVVGEYLIRVESGLKRVNDVREQIIAMQTAINNGSGPALDAAIETLNSLMGRTSTNSQSLLANPTQGNGSWSGTTTSLSGAGMSEDVATRFMGSDYIVKLDDGSGSLVYDGIASTLGGIDRSNIEVLSHGADDSVTLRDNSTGTTYSGQIMRGGLGMLNSWGYGDLSTPEAKAKAQADLDKAISYVAKGEREWLKDQTSLSVMQKGMSTKMEQMKAEYDKVSTEELDAKQAERRAIKTRFDMLNNSLALTQGRASNLLTGLFANPYAYEKPSWGDIMGKANGLG
ncbi:MAG TPA: hypothetical protein VK196_01935 [Magnetospirillum sp.]|nr:hypothetical protein [Magnetospirillum sp.]